MIYRRVQGYLCRGLLLVLYFWHSMKFLLFFYCQLSAQNHLLLLWPPFYKWVRNELWMKKISQFAWPTGDTSFHGKQISVHTRELASEIDSCNRFAPGACSLISSQTSLIWGSKTREQNFFCATYFFARNRRCRRGSFAPGACCRSVLQEQAPSCVPALTSEITMIRSKTWTGAHHPEPPSPIYPWVNLCAYLSIFRTQMVKQRINSEV